MNDLNQAHLKTDHAASLAAVAERIGHIARDIDWAGLRSLGGF